MAFWNNLISKAESYMTPQAVRDKVAPNNPYMNHLRETSQMIDSLKKGGPIKKTGMYRLHKGERVLNKKQELARKMNKHASH